MNNELEIFEMAESRCRSGQDPLLPFLQGARKSPVQIQAQAVEKLDAMRLQILLSARKKWQEEHLRFEMANSSPQFHIAGSCAGQNLAVAGEGQRLHSVCVAFRLEHGVLLQQRYGGTLTIMASCS